MKLARCPVCHTHIDLLSLVEDQAGRDLLIEVAKLEGWAAPSLLSYLSLFKPAKSDLNNARALKLLQEVLMMHPHRKLLSESCDATVQQIRAKRVEGSAKPLKDHAYLKSVIETRKNDYHSVTQSTVGSIQATTRQYTAAELAAQQQEHFNKLKNQKRAGN
ncbi:hypothetical protein DS2_10272 [Catenovulum agarivorans DS-2]|uniref:Uncharacterized protein n=1 Tax=Catenovulum agarivorans DS-2 TaxID=1328313 RepID=W7QPL7_9ALTE|nr:hypothetical protein [Catenovulum agarivorans]EWH09828.1 hypothetical protein DS2_10272 [Catenovulum agarivorans DS-2]